MAELAVDKEEDVQEEEGKLKKNILPLILKIVKYVLFFTVLALFVVVVSIITIRAVQGQSRIQNSPGQLTIDVQQGVPEDLDWYSTLGSVRGNLLDENPISYVVDLYLGYVPGDQAALLELTRRNVQIKERITLYFSSQYESDVQGARNIIKMKNELREIINRMMNNKIREVAFNNIQVIPF